MPTKQEEDHTRGSVISVVIGLAASALGGMLIAAAPSAPPDDQPVLSGLGVFLLVIGAPMFFIAILVELFSIGTHVRSIAKLNQATLSLLRDQPADAPSTTYSHPPHTPTDTSSPTGN